MALGSAAASPRRRSPSITPAMVFHPNVYAHFVVTGTLCAATAGLSFAASFSFSLVSAVAIRPVGSFYVMLLLFSFVLFFQKRIIRFAHELT